jgi:hypothetical protein
MRHNRALAALAKAQARVQELQQQVDSAGEVPRKLAEALAKAQKVEAATQQRLLDNPSPVRGGNTENVAPASFPAEAKESTQGKKSTRKSKDK